VAFLFEVTIFDEKSESMESLWRRLKYYGIGFGIGRVFVIFFFQNRGCSWLPSNRVKNSILDRLVVASDETLEILRKKNISQKDILTALNDGDVVFGESKKKGDVKVYVVEKDDQKFLFALPEESILSEVFIGGNANKRKVSKTGRGKILRFPMDDELMYLDTTKLMTCQKLDLGIKDSKQLLKIFKANGRVDFEQSNLKMKPKPIQYFTFKHMNKEIGMEVIWYKNKLNISSFAYPNSLNCGNTND